MKCRKILNINYNKLNNNVKIMNNYLMIKKHKLKIVGIDPASNMCKIARTRAIPTINNFFICHLVYFSFMF